MIVKCDHCGENFDKKPCEIHRHNYCNKTCFRAASSSGLLSVDRRTGKMLPCEYCGVQIYVNVTKLKSYKHHFCNLTCLGRWKSKNMIGENASNYKGGIPERACQTCGKVFKPGGRSWTGKYCSIQCRGISQQNREQLKCANCEKEFFRAKQDIYWAKKRNARNSFCSHKCKTEFNRGKNHHCWISDRSKIKSEIRCLRYSAKMQEWRNSIFERDNYTCQMCNKRGGYIQAHHIKKFADNPQLRTDHSNGITLCKKCHKSILGMEELFESVFFRILNKKKSEVDILLHSFSTCHSQVLAPNNFQT